MKRFLLPVLVFGALVVLLALGLRLDPKAIPSPLIGRQIPDFHLTQLHAPEKMISPADMAGQVWLLNIWASWCVSCREEHPYLMDLVKLNAAPIVGLNYKDGRQDGTDWLRQFGNPYSVSAFDSDGRVGIDFGVYGVPETFVIDKRGVIRYKHIGPLTPEVVTGKLLPLIRELNRG